MEEEPQNNQDDDDSDLIVFEDEGSPEIQIIEMGKKRDREEGTEMEAG